MVTRDLELAVMGYQQTDVWRDLQGLELSQDSRELPWS
jgi:hypothetical protein